MEGYITVKEAAEKWGLCIRRVQYMCSDGPTPGVTKFGGMWVVPEDAERPIDGRVKTGKYKGWRDRYKKEEQQ